MSKKYSCHSGGEKRFLLDIPFNRTSRPSDLAPDRTVSTPDPYTHARFSFAIAVAAYFPETDVWTMLRCRASGLSPIRVTSNGDLCSGWARDDDSVLRARHRATTDDSFGDSA
jgi:hypothetical protein